jgi:hypothetical protein
MTAEAPPVTVAEPGVYQMSLADYLADPVPGGSLSSSGARKLLPPSCPARFRYDEDHPPEPTKEMALGKAAHLAVLGVGPEVRVVDANDWRTNAAKDARARAYAEGSVPLLVHEFDVVVEMATALRLHPIAGRLLQPGTGKPEQALFWRDDRIEVWRRALLDWLPSRTPNRMIVPEYKTCESADRDAIERAIYRFGYHQQAAWYLDAVRALGLSANPAFVLICQEKTPPYLVNVAEPDPLALRVGAERNRQAIDLYRECVEAGVWPGYSDEVELVGLPAWVENAYLREMNL